MTHESLEQAEFGQPITSSDDLNWLRERLIQIREGTLPAGNKHSQILIEGELTVDKMREAESRPDLTKREKEVFKQVARGLSNGEIADELTISGRAVSNYLGRIFAKTGSNRRDIIREGVESGLVVPDQIEGFDFSEISTLSKREMQVFKHLAKKNKDIALELELGRGTVKNYVSNIYSKLGILNRWEALSLLSYYQTRTK